MKKKIIVVITPILLMMVVFWGCNTSVQPGNNVITKSYGTNYEDYFDSLGPYLDCMSVYRFYEDDNEIELSLDDKRNYDMEESFADVLDAHNDYVDNNANYFPSEFKISITEIKNGIAFVYSNDISKLYQDKDFEELKVEDNNYLQYCLADREKYEYITKLPDGEYRNKVKVLMVDCIVGVKNVPPTDVSFVEYYPNLEKIAFIIDWDYDETDAFYGEVLKINPDLEIYTYTSSGELIKYGD